MFSIMSEHLANSSTVKFMNHYENYNAKTISKPSLNTWFFTARFVQQQLAENRRAGNVKRQYRTGIEKSTDFGVQS